MCIRDRIEGASEGLGLGHDFLRHVERTRQLIHVLDVSGFEGRDPVEDFEIIMGELERYSEELARRPMIVAANKMDIPPAEENLARLREYLEMCIRDRARAVINSWTSCFMGTRLLDGLLSEYASLRATVPLPDGS